MRKVVKKTLSKQISETLEEMINNGEFEVGAKIPAEPELVESFGVSRNTVREAIQSLTHMGLLETRQGDGTYVVARERLQVDFYRIMRETKQEDIIEVRNLLERHIVCSAIKNRTEEDIDEIGHLLEVRSAQINSAHENTRADINFHVAVARATHNEILVSIYTYVTAYYSEFIYEILRHNELDQKYVDEIHYMLYKAIKEKNVSDALMCVEKIIGI